MDPATIVAVIAAIGQAEQLLMGLINITGATKVVSDIIGNHMASGSTTWTDDERKQVTDALEAAKVKADGQITAAGG